MTAVIISILLWPDGRDDVTFQTVRGRSCGVGREGRAGRSGARASDRADTGDEICAIPAKTCVKARATLMDVKTNYESGR